MLPVCTTDELPGPGKAIRVTVGELEIGIFNVDGVFCAVDDICTHEHSSLSDEGWVDGDVVECSFHGRDSTSSPAPSSAGRLPSHFGRTPFQSKMVTCSSPEVGSTSEWRVTDVLRSLGIRGGRTW